MDQEAKQLAAAFGRNLAAERQRKKNRSTNKPWTQSDLADAADLDRSAIGFLESGQRLPRLTTLIKLAGALGVPPAKLLTGLSFQPGQRQRGRFRLE